MFSCFAACPRVIPAFMSFFTAETFSLESGSRPGFLPRFLAAAMPSRVRSAISRRSKWAIEPNTWKTSSPAAEMVSTYSSMLIRPSWPEAAYLGFWRNMWGTKGWLTVGHDVG